jgi:hypothetical protein
VAVLDSPPLTEAEIQEAKSIIGRHPSIDY